MLFSVLLQLALFVKVHSKQLPSFGQRKLLGFQESKLESKQLCDRYKSQQQERLRCQTVGNEEKNSGCQSGATLCFTQLQLYTVQMLHERSAKELSWKQRCAGKQKHLKLHAPSKRFRTLLSFSEKNWVFW